MSGDNGVDRRVRMRRHILAFPERALPSLQLPIGPTLAFQLVKFYSCVSLIPHCYLTRMNLTSKFERGFLNIRTSSPLPQAQSLLQSTTAKPATHSRRSPQNKSTSRPHPISTSSPLECVGTPEYDFRPVLISSQQFLSADGHHGLNGFTRYFDFCTITPFLFNPSTNLYISYEDSISILAKAVFARAKGLGGVVRPISFSSCAKY